MCVAGHHFRSPTLPLGPTLTSPPPLPDEHTHACVGFNALRSVSPAAAAPKKLSHFHLFFLAFELHRCCCCCPGCKHRYKERDSEFDIASFYISFFLTKILSMTDLFLSNEPHFSEDIFGGKIVLFRWRFVSSPGGRNSVKGFSVKKNKVCADIAQSWK